MTTPVEQIKQLWAEEWGQYTWRTRGVRQKFHSSAKWDGGQDAMGRRYKSVWEKAIHKYRELAKDPSRFIKAQFYNRQGEPPLPNILLSDIAVNKYKEFTREFNEDIKTAFKTQVETAKNAIYKWHSMGYELPDAALIVLGDISISLSALFRYYLAMEYVEQSNDDYKQQQFKVISDTWFTQALKQYAVNPDAYDSEWKQPLSSKLKQALSVGDFD